MSVVDQQTTLLVSQRPLIVRPGATPGQRRHAEAIRRRAEARQLRAAGWTLRQIGDHLGVTRQRVRQLLMEVARPQRHPRGRPADMQIKAARALLGWSGVELARRAGLGYATIQRAETGAGVDRATRLKIRQALEAGGAVFIEADSDGGVGVRLRAPEGAL